MNWLIALTGDTRARLLQLVRGSARTVPELAKAVGITENAVRTHVAAAERDGLVRPAGVQRSTGGKPARTYELTPEAEELFPKAYTLVFTELLRTLRDEQGDEAVADLLRRVGRRLGAGAESSGADATARVAAAARLLESIGGSVEVTASPDGWILGSTGCPLSGIVSDEPTVCALAESIVAEATGMSVTETCERNGRPRCTFRITAAADGA